MSTGTALPTITCPTWCEIPQAEHRQRLEMEGGIPMHSGRVGMVRLVGDYPKTGGEVATTWGERVDPYSVVVDESYLDAEAAIVLARDLVEAARRLDPSVTL